MDWWTGGSSIYLPGMFVCVIAPDLPRRLRRLLVSSGWRWWCCSDQANKHGINELAGSRASSPLSYVIQFCSLLPDPSTSEHFPHWHTSRFSLRHANLLMPLPFLADLPILEIVRSRPSPPPPSEDRTPMLDLTSQGMGAYSGALMVTNRQPSSFVKQDI